MSRNRKDYMREYMREYRTREKLESNKVPDNAILAAAFEAPNGEIFQALYQGRRIDPNEDSLFLTALVTAMWLMYYSGHDARTVYRICRQSDALKDVWDNPYKYGYSLGEYVIKQAYNLQQARGLEHD